MRPQLFDRDEAQRLRRRGLSYRAIGALLKVAHTSVREALCGKGPGRSDGVMGASATETVNGRRFGPVASRIVTVPAWVPRDLRFYYASVRADRGEHTAARYVRELKREGV